MSRFIISVGLLFYFLALPALSFSQSIIAVKNIKGIAYIAGDISENLARQNAIKDAKIEALRKAGISEYINSYQTLFTSQANDDFSQFFNSDIQSEIRGNIKSYIIKSEEKVINPATREIEYHIVIDAEVIKYETTPDVAFGAIIEGIKGAYNNDENLSFSLRVTKDCYLTVFNISDSGSILMYPNGKEKSQLFTKDYSYSFPLSPNLMAYKLHIAGSEKETNRMIFVFTKEQIPYIDYKGDGQITDIEKIFTWIYSIMPDQRHTEYYQFLIVR